MKKYIKPIITAVNLDSEQALLMVCAVAASGWMLEWMGQPQCNAGGTRTWIGTDCRTAVRGRMTSGKVPYPVSQLSMPS
ncbi:MAG: hypothetical protein PHQ52_05735 [Candidatus Omnitrophica bacterium]|nr:hypothetical protein [Candidatus Omnitrophota bacterium]